MAEEAVALAEEKRKSDRYATLLRNRAEESVNTYLERHKDKIPMALYKKGIKDVLMHFAAKEGDEDSTVNLALPGESQPTERSEYALVTTLLAELPPLIAEVEKTELATGGVDGETGTDNVIFADADEQSARQDLAAQKIMFAAKSKGETITYLEALRRVELAGSK